MQARYRIHAGLLLLVLMAPVFVDPGAQVRAQAVCEKELTDAEQAYTFGRFDEAIQLLNRCLDRRTVTGQERQRAYRLIGLSYLGKDVLGEARASVRRLLELVPDYRPDPDQDPPPFVDMVEDVRREMRREPAQLDPPQPDTPQPDTPREKRRGVSKWVWIGGAAVLAGVAAAVLLSGGGDGDGDGNGNGPPQPTTLNEVEPNNSAAQAQVIRGNPPITVRGNAEVGDVGDLVFTDLGDDIEDLYRITLTSPGLQLSLSGFASDCDLYLLDAQATQAIDNSINGGATSESISQPNLAVGTYLIGVAIFDDDPQGPNNTAYTLTVNAAVSGASQRVVAEQMKHVGGAALASDFRLVAHAGEATPLHAALPDRADVAWTAFHDEGVALVEYDGTETFDLRPGRGFWVQSATPLDRTATGASVTAPLGDTYAVPLDAGWNIIANPFDAPLDWAAVQQANGITQTLWRWWDGHFVQAETFAPARRGEAYYFMNLTRREALTIPHPSRVRAEWTARPASPSVLTLAAYREGRPASSVRVGFVDDAAPGFDGYDQLAPPGYFEAASLRLMRDVSSQHRFALADEFRPWGEAGAQFDLVLKAPAHATLELRVEGLEAFSGYGVYLIDPVGRSVYDLHARPVISLTPGEALSRYRLVVGTEAFTRAIRDEVAPEAIRLSNYPNPFNPSTRIAYTVPASAARAPVRLEVFDMAGRRVRVLVDGVQDPGAYQVTWDGTDAAGVPVASGVYLSRLRAGAHTQVQQMLLMK